MRACPGAVTPGGWGVTAGPSLGHREGEREMEDSPVTATLSDPPQATEALARGSSQDRLTLHVLPVRTAAEVGPRPAARHTPSQGLLAAGTFLAAGCKEMAQHPHHRMPF